jgi:hypothetical protein
MMPTCAIIKVISPKEADACALSNTLVGCVSAFPSVFVERVIGTMGAHEHNPQRIHHYPFVLAL